MSVMWRVMVVGGLIASALSAGCSDGGDHTHDAAASPLQPLIYTEDPELTPEGAAVRERRLERQLLEGSAEGPWGRLEQADVAEFPALEDKEALGKAIAEALLERDEELWEYIFVDAQAYTALVNVDEASAAEFVDNQIGESLVTWELFAQPPSSEMPVDGLGERIRFQELKLGNRRTIEGGATDDDDEVVQHWHNRVVLEDRERSVQFELAIPRIFVVDDAKGRSVLQVASEIEADPRFQAFLDAGLHLKPELLRAREYPFPLGVGTFWRYRRVDAESEGDESVDSLEQRIDEGPDGLAADEVIIEVRDVARYGPVRLVELLRSYNDRRHTRAREWWVVTPRRIYACDSSCRDRVGDVDWLLGYFERNVPLLVLPLEPGKRWKEAGQAAESEESSYFMVDQTGQNLEVPAGSFRRAFRISGTAVPSLSDPYLQNADVARYFAPDRGVVQRRLSNSDEGGDRMDVVEELVEYRLMY